MHALALTAPRLPAVSPGDDPYTNDPVVLLQLDATMTAEAVSVVYREVRRGRRAVAALNAERNRHPWPTNESLLRPSTPAPRARPWTAFQRPTTPVGPC